MTYSIDLKSEEHEAKTIIVGIGDSAFRISVNKFDELVINKTHFGSDDGTLIIKPSVSNEIRII